MREAGPQPYPAAALFGVVGALAAEATPERQEWNARVNDCIARAKSGTPVEVAVPMGAMLPGALYTKEGRVLDFAIEKTTGSGAVTALDPVSKESFSGTYVAIMGADASTATATAYLRGDKGAALTCEMQIQPGDSPHGLGTCNDNRKRSYRLQF